VRRGGWIRRRRGEGGEGRGGGGEGRRKRMRSYLEAVDGAIASQVHSHL
jgi:hypothetical protein